RVDPAGRDVRERAPGRNGCFRSACRHASWAAAHHHREASQGRWSNADSVESVRGGEKDHRTE
ncbi:unnamed protein product, partial [Pylaiella littoralis]